MSRVVAWRWCVAAGVAAFLCSWGFGKIPGLVACGPSGGLSPIIAFEFVRSPADVAALFGVEPCRSTLVAAQKVGLLLDGLGFIPAYVAFLSFAAFALGGGRWLIPVFVIAGMLDEIEGGLLWTILARLPGDQGLIDPLSMAVYGKFVLLGLGSLGIAALLFAHRRWSTIVASLAVTIGSCAALAGLASGPSPLTMLGFTIAWVTILASAILACVRPSLFAAPGDLPPAPAPPSA